LLHVSEIAEQRIRSVRDELKEGDQVMVKVINIEGNKIRLSRKAVLREQRDKQRRASSAPAPHQPEHAAPQQAAPLSRDAQSGSREPADPHN
jgi:polyribonucleotide nucleotidyltransferase